MRVSLPNDKHVVLQVVSHWLLTYKSTLQRLGPDKNKSDIVAIFKFKDATRER